MDYLKAIDIQARMRFYDEKDHLHMCLEAVEWNKKRSQFEVHQISWRLARACFLYYGSLFRKKMENEGKLRSTALDGMLNYSKDTLKQSECHPMGRKYKAISLWLMAREVADDETEMELLSESKKLLDEAIETLPNDHELRQYRALWHYRASNVSAFTRLAARFLRGFAVPKGSIEEAIADLTAAEGVHQTEFGRKNYRITLLRALCCASKGHYLEAEKYLRDCQILPKIEDSVDGDLMEDDLKQLKEKIANSRL